MVRDLRKYYSCNPRHIFNKYKNNNEYEEFPGKAEAVSIQTLRDWTNNK